MSGIDLLGFAAVLLMVGGLAAVLWEILAKEPRALLEIATDSQRFAEMPVAAEEVRATRRPLDGGEAAANSNRARLAA